MGQDSIEVVSTKLDILITDFQRFRNEQDKVSKALTKHSKDETEVQAKIATTQKWHTVIGSFIVGVLGYHIMKHGL